ncbi:MAG TPA: hypothetical protein VEK79_08105 [Thermoanaerobaculia bacterium]|nr:hypothetical protein [Thermoanaerobaculia bacterium]
MRALAIVLVLLGPLTVAAQEQEPLSETIYVIRYGLDVRVTDDWGRAIEDLTKHDFTVTIGGKRAHVETAEWIGQGARAQAKVEADEADQELLDFERKELRERHPVGRSIVIFIQTDFARVSMRVLGQMKFHYIADKILELLGPEDRVAVLSHDSHLKFRRDFTNDHKSIRKAVREALFIDTPPPPAPATIGAPLRPDPVEMKRAATGEAALLVIAKALHEIEGERLIIVGGWGMGERQGRSGVRLEEEWNEAVDLLRRDHIPVITLNTGLGGELTFGLAATAAATGGFYAGTQDFESQAIERVKGALAGYYALTLRIDDLLKPGEYALNVKVNRRGANVQAPAFVVHGR